MAMSNRLTNSGKEMQWPLTRSTCTERNRLKQTRENTIQPRGQALVAVREVCVNL